MARLYFHCSNTRRAVIDEVGIDLSDLREACHHAARVVKSFVASPTLEDWRSWTLHVWDDLGDEVFAVPFAPELDQPN